MTMLKTVTAVSEQHLKLSSRQLTLEQLMIQYLGNKVRTNAGIDATKEMGDIGINTDSPVLLNWAQKTGQVQGSKLPGPTLLAPILATRSISASPLPMGSRKSPRLLEKDLPVATLSKCFITGFSNHSLPTQADSIHEDTA